MNNFSNKDYYKHLTPISGQMQHQFDLVEATIAHLFRSPHPALAGQAYGAAFCDTLLNRGLIDQATPVIVEVGGGLGDFALAFVSRLRQHQLSTRYIIVDISPALQKEQQAKAGHLDNIAFILGDGQHLPFAKGEIIGTILSNEVIADFDSVELTPTEFYQSNDSAINLLKSSYQTQVEDNIVVNSGAIEFIQEIDRVLGQGNVVLTEHGVDQARLIKCGKLGSDKAEETHFEVSIDFGHLTQIATCLGFSPELVPLIDFLPFKKDVRVANFNDARALHNAYPQDWAVEAIPLARLYQVYGTELTEALLTTSQGLRFPAIGADGFPDDNTIPFREAFKALILHKLEGHKQ